MIPSLAGIVGAMADASDAFEEAVRCRAAGVGLVPIEVIRKLTPSEWGRIRMLDQAAARRLIAVIDRAEPVIIIEVPQENVDHGH